MIILKGLAKHSITYRMNKNISNSQKRKKRQLLCLKKEGAFLFVDFYARAISKACQMKWSRAHFELTLKDAGLTMGKNKGKAEFPFD